MQRQRQAEGVTQSGRPDSNRRRPAWEAGILPTELRPRDQRRTNLSSCREPQVGIEPTTARLRIECSTTELRWRLMPWRGLEPRRLAAPPPQDGVSTNFTTRAITACCLTRSTPADPHLSVLRAGRAIATGPTGLEPATSRVTVECSNQTELRPLVRRP